MKPDIPEWAMEKARSIGIAGHIPTVHQRIARALITAKAEAYEEAAKGQTLPDAEYYIGEPVEKFTGEAQWEGLVVSAYHTTKGKLRYVVEVQPQGFQMIAVPSQLRSKAKEIAP